MRQVLTFLLVLLCFSAFGQGREIRKSLSEGRKPGRFYVCNPSVSEQCTLNQLLQYAKANDLLINSIIEGEVNRYGKPYTCVVYAEFMPNSEKATFLSEKGHAEDFTDVITTAEELRLASEVDQERRNNKQSVWHHIHLNMNESSFRKVLTAKHYVFGRVWQGYSIYDIYYAHISDIGPTILNEFGSGMSISQFQNKVQFPVFKKNVHESVSLTTMCWDGEKDANGRPKGFGHALKMEGSDEALFVTGTFVNGLPEGKITYNRIKLPHLLLHLAKVPTYNHLTTWDVTFTSGDGMCRRGDTFFDYNCQLAFSLRSGEKTSQTFRNGLLRVTKEFGGRELAYNLNKKGELVSYTDAAANAIKTEVQNYVDIVGEASVALVKTENYTCGLVQKVAEQCSRKSYSPNMDLISHILESDQATKLVGQQKMNNLRALTLLQKSFGYIDDAAASVQFRKQMNRAMNGSILAPQTFFEALFLTRSIADYEDYGLSFYNSTGDVLNNYYADIDRLSSLSASNWAAFKSKSLRYVDEQAAMYRQQNDEPRRIWYSRVDDYRAKERQQEINYRERQLKLCRVDGDKSTMPSGWVPEDNSWFFGHPGYSEDNGTIYLENGDYVEWSFYGEKVQIMDGTYAHSSRDTFNSVQEMVTWLLKTATERWQRELDRY